MSRPFMFYESWWDNIMELYEDDVESAKDIFFAILQYGVTEKATFPMEKGLLKQVYAEIDRAAKKHEQLSQAGRKGGSNGTGESKARYGNKNASKKKKNVSNDNENEEETQASLCKTQRNKNLNKKLQLKESNLNLNLNENMSSRSPSGTAPLDGGGPSELEDEDKSYLDLDWGDD